MQTPVSRRRFLAKSGLMAAGGLVLAGTGSALLGARPAFAAAGTVGAPAPTFTATDIAGKAVNLADLKGKVVVLEWTNHQCPFVVKHYATGNMQALQKEFTGKGVVWLTIVSSAPGEQGAVDATQAAGIAAEAGAAHTHKILDPQGTIGRMFDAKVTPHMYVIGTDGTLLYNGAIDSIRSTKKEDVEKAEPLLKNAVNAVLAGQPVQNATNQAYGCTIKYAKTTA